MTTIQRADDIVIEVETIGDLEHEHDDDCNPCDRDECPHLSCEHDDDGCQVHGCDCDRWLAWGDCHTCSGVGSLTLDHDGRDIDVPCRDCCGTGDAR